MATKEQYEFVKVVRKLQIFRTLDEAEALCILGLAERQSYLPGAVVWMSGDPGVDMQVLLTGRLEVKNADGEVIGRVCPGASFGEMACLTGRKRFVGIEAPVPSTSLSWSREALRSLIPRQPRLYVKVLETTIELLAHRVTLASAAQVRRIEEGEPTLW